MKMSSLFVIICEIDVGEKRPNHPSGRSFDITFAYILKRSFKSHFRFSQSNRIVRVAEN